MVRLRMALPTGDSEDDEVRGASTLPEVLASLLRRDGVEGVEGAGGASERWVSKARIGGKELPLDARRGVTLLIVSRPSPPGRTNRSVPAFGGMIDLPRVAWYLPAPNPASCVSFSTAKVPRAGSGSV